MFSLFAAGQAQRMIFQQLQELASSSKHRAVYSAALSRCFGQRLRARADALLVLQPRLFLNRQQRKKTNQEDAERKSPTMGRRNKVLHPGALQYVGEADGCFYMMGFPSVL